MTGETNKNEDIVEKFRTYRMGVETTEIKLKESIMVIDQLRIEIKLSRDLEENLRNQISFAQDRLIHLQKSLSKLVTILEKQRQTDKTCQQIEWKVEQLTEAVQQSRDQLQNLSKRASKQLELDRENDELKSILESKTSECDLMKIEIQALAREKKELIAEHQEKVKDMESQLEKLRSEKSELQTDCDKTLLIYKRQIEENEQIIKEYERERKSLLEEFDCSKGDSVSFVSADSTVSINPETKTNKKRSISQTDPQGDSDDRLFQSFQVKPSTKVKFVNYGKEKAGSGFKKKPQLDFLQSTQSSSQGTSSESSERRRLFSTNCNHYLN